MRSPTSSPGRVPVPTERLSFRPWTGDDAADLCRLFGDEQIRQVDGQAVTCVEDARAYIERARAARESGAAASFALRVRADGAIAGGVGLYGIQPRTARTPASACVSLWLDAGHRGRGYGTEGLRALARWSFAELGLDRLAAFYHPGNHAVQAVNDRVGFVRGPILRSAVLRDGVPGDLGYADLLPADLVPPQGSAAR